MPYDYDLVVIGSGPGGRKAAIQAAKLGRRVALIDRREMIGGVCTNTGTIPSKTLREAVVYLTGMSERGIYGQSYRVKEDISSHDVFHRTQHVVQRDIDVVRSQLARNHVVLLNGHARFADPHTLTVVAASGEERRVTAAKIVIAVGTVPARPATVAFDGHRVLSSDDILGLDWLPSSLVVVGAGVIGIEYASMFAALGCKVTVVEQRRRLLEFCDSQIIEALQYHLRDLNVIFRFDEKVTAVEKHGAGAVTHLASGKLIPADAVLYSTGRQGATDALALKNAGLEADQRGRIAVNDRYRTAVRHIYAVGDVIGFPSLAATSMEQGRLAACDAFGVTGQTMGKVLPIGIYTIPEISFVGRTEEELTEAAVPYEIGIARYRELARGQILGDVHGMLKLLVSATDHTLLGVHAFGTGATELVHIGQLLMTTGGHGRGARRHGLQLPDARRVVQGRRARCDEPPARGRAARRLKLYPAGMSEEHLGGCLCGAVRYRVEGPLRGVIVCHCGVCRRTHAGPAHFTACPRERLEITTEDDLRWHEHDGARRGFCRVCGSRLFWDRGRATLSIAAGSLDEPTGLSTSDHIYTASAGDWYDVPPGRAEATES